MKRSWPAWLTLVIAVLYIGYRLINVGGNVAELAEIGTQFASSDPQGTEGYDGQFTLYVARNPDPADVAPQLDEPAYRYQRILLPILARALVLGRPEAVPWSLLLVTLVGHVAGTYAIARALDRFGRWVGFACLYGLWAGTLAGVGTMLHEPLAYGLIAVALWAYIARTERLAYLALALAIFSKETTLPFLAAFLLTDASAGRLRSRWWVYGLIGGAFLLWQGWLFLTFGEPGLGSGGAGATSFEWIPFLGFFKIGGSGVRVLGIYLLLFGPGVILPAVWGLWQAVTRLLARPHDVLAWSLALNAVVIFFLPFSTFREPFGLIRLATGLVIAFLLFSAEQDRRRPLVYSAFWLAYLPLIL